VALVTAVNQTLFGLAPVVFGVLHDATVGYAVPFALAFTLQIVAAVVVVMGADRQRRKRARDYGLQGGIDP
jgi:cyanate permease